MSRSEFRLALEAAVQRKHSSVHPWSEAWVSGKLNKRLLGEWVKQHYHFVSHAAEWLAAIYGNCPHEEVRDFLLENMCEEEGVVGKRASPRSSTPSCCSTSRSTAASSARR